MKIALTWYEEGNYTAARAIMDDARVLPETFARWQKGAEKAERDLGLRGYDVVRAFIDPAKFPAWCEMHGMGRIDATARKVFANYVAAGKDGSNEARRRTV